MKNEFSKTIRNVLSILEIINASIETKAAVKRELWNLYTRTASNEIATESNDNEQPRNIINR